MKQVGYIIREGGTYIFFYEREFLTQYGRKEINDLISDARLTRIAFDTLPLIILPLAPPHGAD